MSEAEYEDDYEEMKTILPMLARGLGKRAKRKGSVNLPGSMLISDIPCFAVHRNPAVQRCCALRNSLILESSEPSVRLQWDKEFLDLYETFEQVFGHSPEAFEIAKVSAMAYRAAMPDPISRRSVKSFIACVLHAMSLGILDPNEGSKLLHGARTAALTLNNKHTRRRSSARAHSEAEAESANLPAPEPAEAVRILNEISTL